MLAQPVSDCFVPYGHAYTITFDANDRRRDKYLLMDTSRLFLTDDPKSVKYRNEKSG